MLFPVLFNPAINVIVFNSTSEEDSLPIFSHLSFILWISLQIYDKIPIAKHINYRNNNKFYENYVFQYYQIIDFMAIVTYN